MPHVAGHSPGGFNYPAVNTKKKTQVKKQANPYLVGSAPGTTSQDLIQAGFTGVGQLSPEDRLKISQQDKDYIAPGAGGTIVTTGQDNISKREKLDKTDPDKVTDTTFVVPPKDDTEDKKITDYEYYLLPNGKLDIRKVKRNKLFFEQLTGKKIANITADGTIIFQDQTQGIGQLKLFDLLGGQLDKLTGFDPTKALTEGGMGDQGKAALWHKLSGMDPEQFREFLNRKGNLDRIREFSGDMSPEAMADFEAKLKAAASTGGAGGQFFADMIASTAGEDFEMLKLKNSPDKKDRERYYQLNPHLLQTSGGLEEAANAGITWIEGYGPVERPDRGGGQQGGGGGIGDFQTTPPATDSTTLPTPDYYLRRQYMPQNVTGFTPDYTGGPEQMHIAGGWWDPTGKKWLGSPWGTQNQFQFNQGGIVGTNPLLFKNQGGMASDKGIKSFKKYGY